MSKNKLKKFAEIDRFEHVFQMSVSNILAGEQFPLRGKWHTGFFGNDAPVTIELGCGRGEYTIEQARQFPEKNFIGIDIKGARLWTGAKQAKEDGLTNVAFLRTDIQALHAFFAPDEISELWITFPDPQMKKCRKRLTSTLFLSQYRRILVPDGIIHLKTDSGFLFAYTCELARVNGLPVSACTDNLYDSPLAQEPVLQIKTYYEQQWLARGIPIKYLAFRLPVGGALIEPDIDIPYDNYRSYGRQKRSDLFATQ
ncbi:MAG: tRNA (guanosine(46)-N7)-methyltransferase TrmB [Prevotellaceae bacterium]|jgi:tRNA (guanine-N7-)-methyltransferase|nr:tRNA (guanosine(46)-N7)-methyltransferase TrmB [Prevotellaceae bacterium]